MADRKPNTVAGDSIAVPFGLPRLDVPGELTMNERGYVVFTLHTDRGPVSVRAYWRTWECRGATAALVAGGLLRPEWCPGLPGNNKSRQPVFFDVAGPHLHVGQRGGTKYEGAHIVVSRSSANRFVVEIPLSAEHRNRIKVLRGQQEARLERESQAAYDKEVEHRRIARLKSETPADVRGGLVACLVAFEGLLSSRLGDCRFRYTEGALAEVNRHIEVAKQLLMTSALIPLQPNRRRDGNVVYLPGQDHAALSATAALH